MDIEHGPFTADGFKERALRHALPIRSAEVSEGSDGSLRGDHDLNPDIAAPAPASGFRPASVLVGVVDRGDAASVILTLRAPHLSSHAGQISFPGGRVDGGDASLIDTALREAHEEIGLTPDLVTPLGLLEPYLTRTGFRIVPVLSLVQPSMTLRPDKREVAEIFEVPLEFLMTVANHQRHALEWEGRKRYFYAMPYQERYIWGATAGILRIMYERLYAE
jgi:8-oxo-dGTP pyrophosphatase MutT (NUDIX family)